MKIADAEFFLVEIPRGAAASPVRSLLVRLTSDQGIEGWGEAGSRWRAAELDARRAALAPGLVGRSVFNVAELTASDALDGNELRAAVEMAHWDLLGRALKQPLCHLWGGAYRQRIPLAVRLPALPLGALPACARELADCGFPAQILQCTGEMETDVAAAAGVREALGPRAELRIDARNGYRFDAARELAAALNAYQVSLLIDPLAPQDAAELSRFARQTETPVAASAGLRSPRDVLEAVRDEAIRAVVLDPESLGGLSAVRQATAVAEAAGRVAALGGRPTLGVGLAARLQLAAAIPCLAIANESAIHELADDLLVERLVATDGMLTVPEQPGLGVSVDRAALDRWQAQ